MDDLTVPIGVTREGHGPTVLMLPALSSISTRHELAELQSRLGRRFETVAVDWPGFGDRPRAAMAWTPRHMSDFLRWRLETLGAPPFATVAAGHAAGYALRAAAERPGCVGRLCLLAPTWRGPLPTMLGRPSGLAERIVGFADRSRLGMMLFRLNVNRPVVRLMARGHVYEDPAFIDGSARYAAKAAVFRAPGARHASLRFVTGMLDPFPDRAALSEAVRRAAVPILVVYGEGAPPRSKAEMAALGAQPGADVVVLRRGKLGLHEEFPDPVADAVLRFLDVAATEQA